ncbi:MAG: hypothetical protein GF320_19620 [Armatimonadia bacterium]|nr:hypothetical protein [Armatimonadia bacterium]
MDDDTQPHLPHEAPDSPPDDGTRTTRRDFSWNAVASGLTVVYLVGWFVSCGLAPVLLPLYPSLEMPLVVFWLLVQALAAPILCAHLAMRVRDGHWTDTGLPIWVTFVGLAAAAVVVVLHLHGRP